MLKRLLLAVVAGLAGFPAAGLAQQEQLTRDQIIARKWDLDSTSEVTAILGNPVTPSGLVETSGSSATVTAVGSATPFANVSVNARIEFRRPSPAPPNSTIIRTVIDKASSTSITIDSVADLSAGDGYSVTFRNLTVTAATDTTAGWFDVNGWDSTNVCIDIDQHNIDGATTDFRIQCVNNDSTLSPSQVYPVLTPPTTTASYVQVADAATGPIACVDLRVTFEKCRIVTFINTGDDATDTGADREMVNIVIKQKRGR